jgi:hypothetical protein
MPLFRTVNGKFEPVGGPQPLHTNTFFEPIIIPTYEVEALPAILKQSTRYRYIQAYTKPPRPPHPRKWRGPRLRNTHPRPSRVPRRYRVSFNRI